MQYGINNLSHMASKAEQFIIEWIHNIYNHFNWCVLSCDHFIFMILHIWGKLEIETGLKPKTTLLLVSIFIEHVTSAKNNRKLHFLSATITNIVFYSVISESSKTSRCQRMLQLRQVNIPFPLDIHDYSIGRKLKFKLKLPLLLKHIALSTSTNIMFPNLSDLPSLQAALILDP